MFNSTATSKCPLLGLDQTSGVFALLLLASGDIVGCALAQLTGGYIAPVAFSFGESSVLLPTQEVTITRLMFFSDQAGLPTLFLLSCLSAMDGFVMPAYPDSPCTTGH
jgi:hypothetical protein